jgi:hypothetical protein
VNYGTDPQDATLAGFGLRMHYDSSKLVFASLGNLLTANFIQQQVMDDTQDFDNDATTDKYVLVSWADTGGNWPGQVTARLFTANFTPAAGAKGQTAVNFSASSTAAGWMLRATSETVTFDPWHNVANPYDVNDDKRVAASDALVVINKLNRDGPGPLPDPTPGNQPPPYYDVNGDCSVTARDALEIINYLNRQSSGGEGESPTGRSTEVASRSADTGQPLLSSRDEFAAAVTPTGWRVERGLSNRTEDPLGSRHSESACGELAARDWYFATQAPGRLELLQREAQARRANASGSALLDADLEDVLQELAEATERYTERG